MKYLNAQDILPEKLLRQLQKHAGGNIIYIPKPKDAHRKWGELTGSREYINKRNITIKQRYANGCDIGAIAEEFCLSYDSIKKIIYT